MPRLTCSVFRDLALWMAGFGLLIGVIFPPFVLLLGVSSATAISPRFYAACLAAGVLVGGVNWGLARLVVGRRLRLLADRMGVVAGAVREAAYTGNWLDCAADRCRVAVDSTDEIGQSAGSFNALVAALTRAHEVEAAVSRFAATLASELDLELLLAAALQQFLAVSEAEAGAVLVVSEGEVSVRTSHGLREPGALITNDHIERALRSDAMQLIDMPDEVRIDALLTSFRPRQVLVVPIAFKSVVLGVLVLAAGTEFRSDARRLVGLLRPTFGLALNNALVHERLQRLAALDPLTDLYNRRFGLERLREEFSRAVRAASPLGVLMVDIDRFKRVNDAYGHVVGDRTLRAMARAGRRVLREGDVFIRYGGDEFLAVLPGASRADVAEIAERLRRVAAETVVVDGEHAIGLTVSIGATSFPEDRADAETTLLERADAALYEAKELGRDRVALSRHGLPDLDRRDRGHEPGQHPRASEWSQRVGMSQRSGHDEDAAELELQYPSTDAAISDEDTRGLRRCIGSARYGIEPHEASVEEFPRPPSQRDGLGRMCRTHWNSYTAGLARDAKARKAVAGREPVREPGSEDGPERSSAGPRRRRESVPIPEPGAQGDAG